MTDARCRMHETRSRTANRLARASFVLAVVAILTGCQGGTGVLRRWNAQNDPTLAKPITADELGDDRNMVARWFNPKATAKVGGAFTAAQALAPTKADPETQAEIAAAEDLFQQGRLAEAERAFARLEKKKIKVSVAIDSDGLAENSDGKNLWQKVKGSPVLTKKRRIEPSWGESVLFYLAESQYQQGRFVAANDTYERLLNQFPGGTHREKAVEREFAIAESWFAAGEDARQAEESAKVADGVKTDEAIRVASWTDHFNGRMPMVDVDGYALRAMEHVRQHDATGPLADDATLRIADHYFKREDWENASAYYDQLIAEYPKSPLIQDAHLGSIRAKISGYIGPEYDSEGLEKARVLIRQTIIAFPNRPKEITDELYKDLDLIADQHAEIAYKHGEFYKRTGYAGGAEYYFGEVSARWPKSPWAEKAKAEMASLAKAPRKTVAPSRILSLPGAPDPNAVGNSMGSMATMPGGAMGGAGGAGAGP